MKKTGLFTLKLFFSFVLGSSAIASPVIPPLEIAPADTAGGLLRNVVLDGHPVDEGSQIYRSTVRLNRYGANGEPRGGCTGVIVSRDLIMTSGHCLDEDSMSVIVQYGIGGGRGFAVEQRALGYRSIHPPISADKSGTKWKDGYLTFDQKSQQDFLENARTRQGWLNFAPSEPDTAIYFRDLALVKVSGIPAGFVPARFYTNLGDLRFKGEVLIAGYGLNSRWANKNDNGLRFAKQILIGHYTPDRRSMALQYYSPGTQRTCYGDSGGAVFIRSEGELKILAIHRSGYNNCANSSWGVVPGYWRTWVKEAATALRSALDI